jgi:hypothetical protein
VMLPAPMLCMWLAEKQSLVADRSWPGAGARVAGTGATLPHSIGMPERPDWGGQLQKSNVARQSLAGIPKPLGTRASIGFPAFPGPTA